MEDNQDSTETIAQEYQLGEVKQLLEKLSSWKKESNRQFSHREISQLISHTQNINKGINVLAEEVYDLRTKLDIITKERDDLIENVDKLSDENRQLKAVIRIVQPSPDQKEGDFHEVGRQNRISYETGGQNVKNAEHERQNPLDNQKTFIGFIGSTCSEDTGGVDGDVEIKQDPLDDDEIDQFVEVDHGQRGNVSEVGSEILKCQECAQSFESNQTLGRHLRAVHRNVCEECGYATKKKASLKKHRAAAHGKLRRVHKKSHVCDICQTTFYHKRSLMRHSEIAHHDSQTEGGHAADKCPSCDFRGKIGAVRMHYSRFHKKKNKKTYVEAKRESNPSLFPSSCGECGMKFSNTRNLKNHIAKCGSSGGSEKMWTLSWNRKERIKSHGTITSQ